MNCQAFSTVKNRTPVILGMLITPIPRPVVEQGQQFLWLSFPEPLNQSRFMITKHLLRTDRQRQNRQA
jgi:hypothetical protein